MRSRVRFALAIPHSAEPEVTAAPHSSSASLETRPEIIENRYFTNCSCRGGNPPRLGTAKPFLASLPTTLPGGTRREKFVLASISSSHRALSSPLTSGGRTPGTEKCPTSPKRHRGCTGTAGIPEGRSRAVEPPPLPGAGAAAARGAPPRGAPAEARRAAGGRGGRGRRGRAARQQIEQQQHGQAQQGRRHLAGPPHGRLSTAAWPGAHRGTAGPAAPHGRVPPAASPQPSPSGDVAAQPGPSGAGRAGPRLPYCMEYCLRSCLQHCLESCRSWQRLATAELRARCRVGFGFTGGKRWQSGYSEVICSFSLPVLTGKPSFPPPCSPRLSVRTPHPICTEGR